MWHGVVIDLTMSVGVGGLALLGGSLMNTNVGVDASNNVDKYLRIIFKCMLAAMEGDLSWGAPETNNAKVH